MIGGGIHRSTLYREKSLPKTAYRMTVTASHNHDNVDFNIVEVKITIPSPEQSQ